MNVEQIMSQNVVSISRSESVSAAARLLRRCNLGALPVCDEQGKLRGMVTDRDIVTRCVAEGMDPTEVKVNEIMTRGVVTASPADSVSAAAGSMERDRVRRLPVVSGGCLVGMVTLCDLARRQGCEMEASAALAEISKNILKK